MLNDDLAGGRLQASFALGLPNFGEISYKTFTSWLIMAK
jgi:hypothetical protein